MNSISQKFGNFPLSSRSRLKKSLVLLFVFAGCSSSLVHKSDANHPVDTQAVTTEGARASPDQSQLAQDDQSIAKSSSSKTRVSETASPSHDDEKSEKANEWELMDDEDGVKTYTQKESQNGIIAFRGEKIMQVPIQKLATILNSLEYRKEWVDSVSESRIVEGAHSLNRIEYSRAHVPWPFQDRDFLFRAKVTIGHRPTSMLIAMNSIEDPREPPKKGIVRGEIFHSYYSLTDISDGKNSATRVVVEIAADPKGSIPNWLVNLTQKKWPHRTLLAIDKCASKPDLKVAPEVELAFE